MKSFVLQVQGDLLIRNQVAQGCGGEPLKYSSPSNSQTEALKQKPNGFVLFVMQHKLVGHFWWEWPVKKMFILQGLLHPRALDGAL